MQRVPVIRDNRASRDYLESRATPANLDLQDLQDLQDRQVCQVCRDYRVSRVTRDYRARLGWRVLRDLPGLLAFLLVPA